MPTDSSQPAAVYRPWLHRYIILWGVAVFVLIAIGGNVTSTGAGMAVPDWPTTFGYNMFTAPPSVWWSYNDRFWEHFHRLMGSLVGLLTIVGAVWLWVTQRARPWLRVLGVVLLELVILQGIMGGLRVTEASIHLAILHGITGQLILALVVLLAAATGRRWIERAGQSPGGASAYPGLRAGALLVLNVLVIQLVLGAWMRHTGAGLAIPDLPTAYGGIIPPLTQEALDQAVAQNPLVTRPYTVAQVAIHFAHRIGALVVLTVGLGFLVGLHRTVPAHPDLRWPARWLAWLLAVQVLLGAMVIWHQRPPDITTAHQATGAALLAVATWLAVRVHLASGRPCYAPQGVSEPLPADPPPDLPPDSPSDISSDSPPPGPAWKGQVA